MKERRRGQRPPPVDHEKNKINASLLRGVLLQAAVGAGGSFRNWSQFTIGYTRDFNQYIGRGLCHGLSMKFLDCAKKGVSFSSEVNTGTLMTPGDYELFGATDLKEEIKKAAFAGNISGQGLREESAHLRRQFNLEIVGSHEFSMFYTMPGRSVSLRAYTRAAQYCSKAKFFYMVSVPGHVLAVAAQGDCAKFFDPNCGIVELPRDKLTRLFLNYFRHEFTQKFYGSGSNFYLWVRRYRELMS